MLLLRHVDLQFKYMFKVNNEVDRLIYGSAQSYHQKHQVGIINYALPWFLLGLNKFSRLI